MCWVCEFTLGVLNSNCPRCPIRNFSNASCRYYCCYLISSQLTSSFQPCLWSPCRLPQHWFTAASVRKNVGSREQLYFSEECGRRNIGKSEASLLPSYSPTLSGTSSTSDTASNEQIIRLLRPMRTQVACTSSVALAPYCESGFSCILFTSQISSKFMFSVSGYVQSRGTPVSRLWTGACKQSKTLSQALAWKQNMFSRPECRSTIRSDNKSYQVRPPEKTLVFVGKSFWWNKHTVREAVNSEVSS